MVTTQYFGIKIQRYMHDHAITSASLARVAAKAFRNGERNPAAWRRKPLTGRRHPGLGAWSPTR